jgi:hypothetical protein
MAGEDNSLGYLRQINEKMDRLLAIAERYVGIPVAAAAPAAPAAPAAAAEEGSAAAGAATYVIPKKGNGNPPPSFVKSFKPPSVPIERTSAQGTARMLRRLLERGVEASERPKIEKQIRDLQPKIDAEIAAGIPLESEFQGQYDAILKYLERDLKPNARTRAEATRNGLKAKLNAEQAALAGAKGGSRRRRKSGKKTRSRRT